MSNEYRIEKLKLPTLGILASFGLSFLDGMFALGFNDSLYIFLGLVMIVCIIMQLRYIYAKPESK